MITTIDKTNAKYKYNYCSSEEHLHAKADRNKIS